jgi:hypothetical protein
MSKRSKTKTKNKKHKATNVYPKDPLYIKSNPSTGHISFTTHTAPILTKQPTKKLNIIQKCKDKKERDTAISLQKQQEQINREELAANKWELFLKSFA